MIVNDDPFSDDFFPLMEQYKKLGVDMIVMRNQTDQPATWVRDLTAAIGPRLYDI